MDRLDIRMEVVEKATDKQWHYLEEQGKQINESLSQNRILIERLGVCKDDLIDLKNDGVVLDRRVTVNEHFRIKWAAVMAVGVIVGTIGAHLLTHWLGW